MRLGFRDIERGKKGEAWKRGQESIARWPAGCCAQLTPDPFSKPSDCPSHPPRYASPACVVNVGGAISQSIDRSHRLAVRVVGCGRTGSFGIHTGNCLSGDVVHRGAATACRIDRRDATAMNRLRPAAPKGIAYSGFDNKLDGAGIVSQ